MQNIPNVKLRGSTYYAYVRVPTDVKKVIGKTIFEKSLQTTDHVQAKRKAAALVAGWWDQIDTARRIVKESNTSTMSHLSDLYKVYQQEAAKHPIDSPERSDVDHLTQEVIEEQAGTPLNHAAWDVITGRVQPLSLYIDQYLADMKPSVAPLTYTQEAKRLERFAESFTDINQINKTSVRTWLSELDLKATTKKIYLATLVRMMRFHDLPTESLRNIKVKKDKQETSAAARAFELEREGEVLASSELVQFLEQLKPATHAAAMISLHTGMRTMEAVNLKDSDIDLEKMVINVRGTKTEAAQRVIPIHPALVPILSEPLPKRNKQSVEADIRRVRGSLGYGREISFYSMRKTFRTSLDYVATPLHIANDLMGHAQSDLGLRVYSQADRIEQMNEYLNKIQYNLPT